jgi:anthranilate phosphoribosyltransferase
VAKHGNVGVSPGCGSSDILPLLGISLSPDVGHLKRSIERNGVCFIHAPYFHPAFKALAPIRKELGFRTIFNALGPLINPARPSFKLSGVYSFELQRVYSYLFQRRGNRERFGIVHTVDGYDEVSLTSLVRIVTDLGACELDPKVFTDILGDCGGISSRDIRAYSDNADNAKLVERILKGEERGARRAVVLANAGVAIWCRSSPKGATHLDVQRLPECLALALESLDSGRAYAALNGCRTG